jgi:glutamate dehydrogenase
VLLSDKLKLIAAFNHAHIFTDPNPNPALSFVERKRLFNLPRSSWTDYDASLISAGGGVYSRTAKSIKITPELQSALCIDKSVMAPNDLIQAILKAPVDLLWNGGIGTFVKASYETHADAGDRTNDNIRIDGNQLRARMVCEGGNLGLTQLGRVEYALNNGIVSTDFVDNSAGVDCSDHEVNIKILLNKVVADGKMTLAERNTLLEQMTLEVGQLVLQDNYEQTQMLSLESSVGQQTMELFRRYMNELERNGRLHRKLEFLPDDKVLLERKANNKGLTRPEIAILIAYCKMYLKQDILASDVPEDPFFIRYLLSAFPVPLRERFLPQLKEHSLRREIIATQLGKSITDHMGINFVERLQRETGASVAFIMRAYVIIQDIFDMEALWLQIEALDLKVDTSVQQKMMLQIYYLIRRSTRWFLRNRKPTLDIESTIKDFTQPIKDLIHALPTLLAQPDREKLTHETEELVNQGVPHSLALGMASCNTLFTSLDIVEAARKHQFSIFDVATAYYSLGNRLELDWLRDQMNAYPMDNQWDELARSGFRDDLDNVHRKLSVSVLSLPTKKETSIEKRIELWLADNQLLITRWQNLVADIKSSNNAGFVMYSVVLRELFDFAQAG